MSLVINLLVLILIAGCSGGPDQTTSASRGGPEGLTVFAAASLAGALPEIAEAFRAAHPGVSIKFNFGGSQLLRSQLDHGARGDVFASADQKQMGLAGDAGLLSGLPVPFATNRLVVIVPRPGAPGAGARPPMVRGLGDLARKGVKLALASPEVPAGSYARLVLNNLGTQLDGMAPGYADRALANVVSLEPNVRSVVQKVALDEVDAGIVYWTDAKADDVAGRIQVLPIPEGSNVAAVYPIAVLKASARPDLAAAFVRFILQPQGQAILRDHGFGPPPVAGFSRQMAHPAVH